MLVARLDDDDDDDDDVTLAVPNGKLKQHNTNTILLVSKYESLFVTALFQVVTEERDKVRKCIKCLDWQIE